MKLLAGDDLDTFFKVYKHDTVGSSVAAEGLLDDFLETGNQDYAKKAKFMVAHGRWMLEALNCLRTKDTDEDSWLTWDDGVDISEIADTALSVAQYHFGIYGQVEVSQSLDNLGINSNHLFYKYFFNCISNAFESLEQKALGDKKYPNYDFSFGPRLDIICEKVNGEARIVLRDNGIGMTEEQIKRIGEKGESGWEGSGLGLAFMDIALPKVGVRYTVESKPLEYAQFTFHAAIKE